MLISRVQAHNTVCTLEMIHRAIKYIFIICIVQYMYEITIVFQACVNFWIKVKGTQDSYSSAFAVTSTSDIVVRVRVILNR